MKKKKQGLMTSKNGSNAFFQKTETESWGLPLMNGGLKIVCKIVLATNILHIFDYKNIILNHTHNPIKNTVNE